MCEWVNLNFPSGVDLTLSYAVPPNLRSRIGLGSLVYVEIGRQKQVLALVTEILSEKPNFEKLKEIQEILEFSIPAHVFAFWKWLGDYYIAPWNRVLDVVIPKDLPKYLSPPKKIKSPKIVLENIPKLTPEQADALAIFKNNGAIPFLIHGVTGSGKTVLMIEMARHILAKGQNVLWLVPEIGLTPQMLGRVEAYLGFTVDVIHSALPVTQKKQSWYRIIHKKAQIVLGTRSAILAPFENVGLIILDEEHDPSYKQMDPSPRYHARDAALWKAHQLSIPIVLASATPSIEIYHRAQMGLMKLLELKNRATGVKLPTVEIVDLRKQREIQGNLSLTIPLREFMQEVLSQGEQVILLHNRRGYAIAMVCLNCGEVWRCPSCDVSLTLHKRSNMLHCHYCDYKTPKDKSCKKCNHQDWLENGVGIEKVEEEIHSFFPDVKVLRLDRDSTSQKGSLECILNSFRNEEAQILLGTQMVVKGHDFPKVKLVGVISADQALLANDFRANESAFQLLTQVAGRSGRSGDGRVIFQSFNPDSEILAMAQKQNYTLFYKNEIQNRQILSYPPFRRILKVEISAKISTEVWSMAHQLKTKLYTTIPNECRLLGPATAPIFKLKNDFRVQILLFGKNPSVLKSWLVSSLSGLEVARNMKIYFDMDSRF